MKNKKITAVVFLISIALIIFSIRIFLAEEENLKREVEGDNYLVETNPEEHSPDDINQIDLEKEEIKIDKEVSNGKIELKDQIANFTDFRDLQTYKNDSYRFQFNYPKSWGEVLEGQRSGIDSNNIRFSERALFIEEDNSFYVHPIHISWRYQIELDIFEEVSIKDLFESFGAENIPIDTCFYNYKVLSIDTDEIKIAGDYCFESEEKLNNCGTKKSLEIINVGGKKAIKRLYDSCPPAGIFSEFVYLTHKNYLFKIGMGQEFMSEDQAEKWLEVFYKFLDTFEFLGPAEEIKTFNLPRNAIIKEIGYGDFNGNGYMDAVVSYDLINVIINDRGDRATKHYLRTFLWDVETQRYRLTRQDEGRKGSLNCCYFNIFDFNNDGKEEVFVAKLYDGTGMVQRHYVMGYKDGEMVDIPIDRTVKNQKWIDNYSYNPDNFSGNILDFRGRSAAGVDGSLKAYVMISNPGEANCCPSGPRIIIEWKLEGGKFTINSKKAFFSIFSGKKILELGPGWVKEKETHFEYEYQDDSDNYFGITTGFVEGLNYDEYQNIWNYRVKNDGRIEITKEREECLLDGFCSSGYGKFNLVIIPDKNFTEEDLTYIIFYLGNFTKEANEIDLDFFREIIKGFDFKKEN